MRIAPLTGVTAGLAALVVLASGCGGRTADASRVADPVAACGASSVALVGDVEPLTPAPTPKLPVTVRSSDGTSVTVRDASRILAVNMYGSLAEIVFSLGLGDHVIGRDASTTFPAAAHLPLATSQGHDLSAEAVLRLNPSIVLADKSIGPPEVLEQVRQAGIPVVLVDDEQNLPAIGEHIGAVAGALGVESAGKRLKQRVDEQIARARKDAPATSPTVAFLYLRGTAGVYLIGGKGAGSDAMIEAIGGVDAGTDAGLTGFRPLTSEGLINTAPDVILVMTSGLKSVGGVKGLLALPGVAQTPAGRHRRIVDVDDGTLLNFGARTGQVITALARAVHQPCAS